MKILITGGAGFIGKYLAHLLHGSHELTALDCLLPQVHSDPEASRAAFPGRIVEGDVSDPEVWAAMPRHDAIVHLAAETGTAQSMYEIERYRRVNAGGTRLAGRTARAWGVPLVAMSSRAVYGEGRYDCPDHGTSYGPACCALAHPAPSRETDPLRPLSVYGETKAEGESVLAAEVATEVPVAIVRPQNVVGPGQDLHNPYTGVLAAFLARLKEGRPITVYGDGTQTRDFVHVQDVARLLAWLVTREETVGEPLVLNSGTGVRTNLTELAHYAAAGSPTPDAPVEYLDVHRAGDIEHAVADMSHNAQVGAPLPQVSTATAVAEFISRSWDKPGAPSVIWDEALQELAGRGLTS